MTCPKYSVLFYARAKDRHVFRVHPCFGAFFRVPIVKKKQNEGRLKRAGTGNKIKPRRNSAKHKVHPA